MLLKAFKGALKVFDNAFKVFDKNQGCFDVFLKTHNSQWQIDKNKKVIEW